MSAHRRLTDEQIEYVKRVTSIKRRIAARLERLPTAEQMAEELHVSKRLIERVSSDGYTVVSRGTRGVEDILREVIGE